MKTGMGWRSSEGSELHTTTSNTTNWQQQGGWTKEQGQQLTTERRGSPSLSSSVSSWSCSCSLVVVVASTSRTWCCCCSNGRPMKLHPPSSSSDLLGSGSLEGRFSDLLFSWCFSLESLDVLEMGCLWFGVYFECFVLILGRLMLINWVILIFLFFEK